MVYSIDRLVDLQYNCFMNDDGRLPDAFRQYFWDYPSADLSLKTDQSLIIQHILANGSLEAIQWLRSQVGDQVLKEWIISRRGRGLSVRQIHFWGLILDIPEDELKEWAKVITVGPWGK